MSEIQGSGSFTNAVVQMPGGDYPELAGQLAKSGLTDREIAAQLRDIVARGDLMVADSKLGDKHAKLMSRVAVLMCRPRVDPQPEQPRDGADDARSDRPRPDGLQRGASPATRTTRRATASAAPSRCP